MNTHAHTQSRAPSPGALDEGLERCVRAIEQGPWTLARLRPVCDGDAVIDGDDLDLLAAPGVIEEITDAAAGWVREGACHARVRRPSSGKTELTLYSIDGARAARYDLWSAVPQVVGAPGGVTFAMIEPYLAAGDEPLRELSPAAGLSLYLHHLRAKKKEVASPRVAARLDAFEARKTGLTDELVRALDHTRARAAVTDEALSAATGYLRGSVPQLWAGRPAGKRRREKLLRAPKRTRLIALVGCDGTGKTTLAQELASRSAAVTRVYKGKSLYRKSWVYKLLVAFVRPLVTRNREDFDEKLAPAAYLRACFSLRRRSLTRREGVTVLDRSVMDFLYLKRKTDTPRWSRAFGLSRRFGVRIPTVHLIVPHEQLRGRKDEITERGHAAYDADMRRALSGRVPADYVGFNNAGDAGARGEALARIVQSIVEPGP